MRYLVTGGTGFIGSYVVQMLREDGHEVTILARNPAKVRGFIGAHGIRFVQGDVRDYDRYEEWLDGHEGVVHNALIRGASAREMLEQDTRTSVHLAECAGRMGVHSFLYTSSIAAFGTYRPQMTEEMRSEPIDWYCATKAATESYLLAASHQFPKMSVPIVRPGYTFGGPVVPGATPGGGSIIEMVRAAQRHEDITVRAGEGTQFLHAGDLMRLYRAILHAGPKADREIYHGVSQPFTTWESVANQVVERVGSGRVVVTEDGPVPQGEPALFDLTKTERAFRLFFDPWPHLQTFIDELAGQAILGRPGKP